ncbi:LysR substrate-binding domain-containing protein [Bacillus sp. T33-2]|uniref:LysR substrate-binding domain-containing protein n=1 Tax=Bacillus sp. T33-2 TaxID=2054168 RepID=UPI00268254B2
MNSLFDGIIDVCVIPFKPQHPDLISIKLFEENFLLIGCPSSFTETTQALALDQFDKSSFLHIPWETPFMEWFKNEIGFTFFPSIEVDDTTIYMKLLLEQKMMGFLPEIVARPYIETNKLRSIKFISSTPIPKRSVYLVYNKKICNSRSFQALSSLIL